MKLTLRFFIPSILAIAITGCPKHCPLGQEIVIPAADATDPTVVMDFHLPNGSIVTVTPTSGPSTIPVPGGGRVTVIVNAKDSEGVQDSQIWAADIKYKIDPNTGVTTQTGPGLLGAPSASNRDSGSQGQKGCTERVATINLDVNKSPTAALSQEVHAVGVNFGGKSVSTPLVRLVAQ